MAIQTDGFSTTIAFADDSDVQMEVKEITPPGLTGGGEIDTTTMANTAWRTKYPKSLKTASECSLVVAWDPALYDEIITMLNANQLCTITFPDSSTLAFWGWIDEFTPNASTEGEQPTANMTIIPSNRNDSNVETAPAYSAAP